MTDSILETMAAVIRSSSSFAPLIALAAGVITSFTPCSLTNVSLIVSYIGNSGEHTTKRSLLYSAVFALGNTITFVILGIIAVSTGTLMGRYSRILYIILGALMILMAFQTWGIFTVIPSTDLLVKNKKRGCAGALVSGVLGGIFSSPCSTPVLIALLATVAAQKSFAWGNTAHGFIRYRALCSFHCSRNIYRFCKANHCRQEFYDYRNRFTNMYGDCHYDFRHLPVYVGFLRRHLYD
jgi:cytochrome c-type biogenesis protein